MKKTIYKSVLPALFMLACSVALSQAPGLTHHSLPEGISVWHFRLNNALLVDDTGKVWLGSQGVEHYHGVLASYFGGEWEIFTTQNSPMPADTTYCLFYAENKLYIGTARGLAIYDGNWEIIDTTNGLPANQVKALHVTPDALFAGTTNGLGIFANNQWTYFNTGNSGIANNNIQALAVDASGKLWIGTGNGLFSYSNDTWTTYNSENSALTGNDISTLMIDGNDNLWIGTTGHGLYRLSNNELLAISDMYDVFTSNNSTVYSLSMSEDGKIWTRLEIYGTYYFVMMDENQAIVFDVPFGINARVAYDNGLLWFFSYPTSLFFTLERSEALMHDALKRHNVNNISTDFTAGGMMAWDSYRHSAHFEVPKGSGKHTLWVQSMWIGGKNSEAELHFAGERYRQEGRYFWPGPVSAGPDIYQMEQEKWNKVWRLNKADIDYHILHWSQAGYQMHPAIASWPAHGDTTSGQQYHIAPFTDVNGSGKYEPHLGDYPTIRGDQALFFVFNDHRFQNTGSGGNNMGIEVRAMAYAFDNPADSALHHTIFLNYQIVNRSGQTYDSVYIGFFTDFDIGWHLDDYIGCDTLLHAYFGYNATPIDGSGQPIAYGEHPPAQSAVFLNRELTSHIWRILNDPWWFPLTPLEQYWLMQAIWMDETPMVHGGMGHPAMGGGTERAWHMFSGDLTDPDQWHELSTPQSHPGDRHSIGSNFVGTFEPGQIICFDKALVFARDYQGDNVSSVTLMKERIQQIRTFFETTIVADCSDLIGTSIFELPFSRKAELKCYPNPAGDVIMVEYVPQSNQAQYRLYNAMGVMLKSSRMVSGITTITLQGLYPGLYIIVVEDGGKVLQSKILKK